MPAHPTRDPDFDEGLDPEGPSAEDLDRFGDEMITCRECGHRYYDQAEICPACGLPAGHEPAGPPVWALITAVVVIAVLIAFWVL